MTQFLEGELLEAHLRDHQNALLHDPLAEVGRLRILYIDLLIDLYLYRLQQSFHSSILKIRFKYNSNTISN